MAPHSSLRERPGSKADTGPRDEQGAQVIDLATRNVLPRLDRRRRNIRRGIAAGVLVAAALSGAALWWIGSTRKAPVAPMLSAPVEQPRIVGAAPVPVALPSLDPLPTGSASDTLVEELAAPEPAPVLAVMPDADVVGHSVAAAPAPPKASRYASPTVVFDAGSGAGVPVTGPDGESIVIGSGNGSSAAHAVGTAPQAGTARSFDPASTVTQGTLIPAVLETTIDTDVPGFVRAIVSTDVRSVNGRKVLVPRSSRLIGQYKSGLSSGQKRAYVIWTRLVRPDGVSVNLSSHGTASAGDGDLKGKSNGQFFERFGSATLHSVVGGLSTLRSGGGRSGVKNGAKAEPALRVRQGEPIRVFTARDVDFSKAR